MRLVAQNEPAVAIAAFDEVVLAHVHIDQRVAQGPATTIASHAPGGHDQLLGRGNEDVGMARRHVDLTGLDTGSE